MKGKNRPQTLIAIDYLIKGTSTTFLALNQQYAFGSASPGTNLKAHSVSHKRYGRNRGKERCAKNSIIFCK